MLMDARLLPYCFWFKTAEQMNGCELAQCHDAETCPERTNCLGFFS